MFIFQYLIYGIFSFLLLLIYKPKETWQANKKPIAKVLL